LAEAALGGDAQRSWQHARRAAVLRDSLSRRLNIGLVRQRSKGGAYATAGGGSASPSHA
jgi:hypothetical protein